MDRTDDEPIEPAATTWEQPSKTAALWRGAFGRCPVCGYGRLFPGWIRMRDQCPRCELWFERVEGHWIGAIGINTILTFGTLGIVSVAGVIATFPDLAVTPLVIIGVLIAVLMPLVIFPTSRTLWSAIDLMMHPLTDRDFKRPAGSPISKSQDESAGS